MLAIWMYFWDEQTWLDNPATSVSAPDVVVISDLGAGGGHRHDQAPPDYWDVRDSYLHYLHDPPKEEETASAVEVVAPIVPLPSLTFLPRLLAERPVVAAKVEASIDIKALKGNFERLVQLDRKIALLKKQEKVLLELQRQDRIAREKRRRERLKRNREIAEKLKTVAKVYLAYSLYKDFLP